MECEASNLWNDYFELGYENYVVDPGVHLAYEADVAAQEGALEVCLFTQVGS